MLPKTLTTVSKSGWPKVMYVFSVGSAGASPYCNPPEWHGYTDYNHRGMCSQWQCNRAVCSCTEGSLVQLQVEDVSSVDMEPSPPPSQSYLVSFMCMWACVYFPQYTHWCLYIFFTQLPDYLLYLFLPFRVNLLPVLRSHEHCSVAKGRGF